jgi:hypothetical protein
MDHHHSRRFGNGGGFDGVDQYVCSRIAIGVRQERNMGLQGGGHGFLDDRFR